MSQLPAADIQSVAVLASWCESGSHLGPVPRVEEYLSSPEKQQLCERIAEQISPTTPLDPNRSQRPAAEGPADNQWQQHAPAEISQRSVDILLRNYYSMMVNSKPANKGLPQPGFLAKLFLLFCPETPRILHVRQFIRLIRSVLSLLALIMVHLDFIILPAWLYLTRQLLQKHMVAEAMMLAVDGVVLALLAGTIYQADQAEKLAKRQGRLTPQQAAMRAPAAPLVAKGLSMVNTGKPSNPGMPGRTSLPTSGLQPGSRAAGTASMPGARGAGSNAPMEFQVLAADLAALQQAVYGTSKGLSSATPDAIAAAIEKICKEVGLAFDPSMVKSYGSIKRTLQDLRRELGC